MYVYAFCILNFKLYDHLTMPPVYKIYPYQFINSEAIKTAHRHKMQGFYGVKEVNGYAEVIFPVNNNGWYMHMNED